MKKVDYHWIEFAATLFAVSSVVLTMYCSFFELRWCKRQREMNAIIDSLGRDPPVVADTVDTVDTVHTIDTKNEEFKTDVFL